MAVKTYTAKSADEVRCWIETQPHHRCDADPKHRRMVLTGHHHRLIVPALMWSQCHVKAGDEFDRRMYRWDHVKEWNARA